MTFKRARTLLGLTQAQAAECWGVNPATVYRWEEEEGATPREPLRSEISEIWGVQWSGGRTFADADVRRVRELYPDGATCAEIAEVLGCSKETIRLIERSAIAKLRDNAELKALHEDPAPVRSMVDFGSWMDTLRS